MTETTTPGRYTIISADSHCGLPAAEYRPYLEERHHDAFDDYLARINTTSGHAVNQPPMKEIEGSAK